MKKTTYNTWVKLTLLAIAVYCMVTLWLIPISNPLIEDLVDTVGAVLFYNFIVLLIVAVYLWANPSKMIDEELEKERVPHDAFIDFDSNHIDSI